MANLQRNFGRRQILAGAAIGAALLPFGSIVRAQGLGLGLGNILGQASDGALNKLAKPNAYYDDKDVRIGLPFFGKPSGLFGSLLDVGERLGILDGLTHAINDAAGAAAGEAKPIFRNAINQISFNDVPDIVSNDDGGTQYLRSSANDDLHGKMKPLVDSALGDLGAYRQLDDLSRKHSFVRRVGLDRDGMNTAVTEQGLDGIFSYMGKEEQELRANPVDQLGKILGDLF